MTYALRGARDLAAYALAAPIAPIIALMALAALGLSGDPVHETVHTGCPTFRHSPDDPDLATEVDGGAPALRLVPPEPRSRGLK